MRDIPGVTRGKSIGFTQFIPITTFYSYYKPGTSNRILREFSLTKNVGYYIISFYCPISIKDIRCAPRVPNPMLMAYETVGSKCPASTGPFFYNYTFDDPNNIVTTATPFDEARVSTNYSDYSDSAYFTGDHTLSASPNPTYRYYGITDNDVMTEIRSNFGIGISPELEYFEDFPTNYSDHIVSMVSGETVKKVWGMVIFTMDDALFTSSIDGYFTSGSFPNTYKNKEYRYNVTGNYPAPYSSESYYYNWYDSWIYANADNPSLRSQRLLI